MISGLNHITLAVTDLDRSVVFYRDVLGCSLVHQWTGGVYLEAGSLWLCLALCDKVDLHTDYTHVALTASREAMAELKLRFATSNVDMWQENRSEGDSLYVLDPDGHKLEIHVGTLHTRMQHIRNSINPSSGCSPV